MKCSVFIATSVDGFIAKNDGSVDWLHTSGKKEVDMGDNADMGFSAFMATVDCMVMGRKCMEVIAAMNLSPEQWPYGNIPIIVLSNSLKQAPENLIGKVEMFAGNIKGLMKRLNREGYKHCYVDGGATIQGFLNEKLIDTLTITKAPVILGEGIPLFGKMDKTLKLHKAHAKTFVNDFIQVKYHVKYL